MSLEPQATTVAVGETFTVRVVVQAGGRRVDGVQCFLNFNYKLLRARSVTTSPPLELLILNNIDNELGHVDYVAGMPFGSEAPSGTFELMTLTLQALAPTAGTTLAFSKQAPRESAVSFGLEGALPLQTLDSRITVVLRAPTPTRPPFVRLPLVLRMR